MFIRRDTISEYLRYVIPTILTFSLAGFYAIVDGYFVGNYVGDAGLAGINVAFAVVAFVMAVGTGIGMGGSVLYSLALGEGKSEKARRVQGTLLVLLALSSIPLFALPYWGALPIASLLGGIGATLEEAASYLRAIAWGAPFQVIVVGCLPLLRNKGAVMYAMVVEIVSGVMNVVFDYVFVALMAGGTAGAAFATVVAQFLAFLLIVAFFLRKKHRLTKKDFTFDFPALKRIATLGLAPFGLMLLPEATVVVLNINLSHFGEQALAAYAVVAYVACVLQMVIQGVCDGGQPLISRYWGAGNYDAARRVRNTNFLVAEVLALVGLGSVFLCRFLLPSFFGASDETTALAAHALPVFCTAYLFYSYTRSSTAYFYAIDDAFSSNAIVYAEAILIVIVATVLAWIAGMDGIWISVTVVQILLSLLALFFLRRKSSHRMPQM